MPEEASPRVVPDGGYGWIVVFAIFMVNFFTDGFFYTIGQLHSELLRFYHSSESATSAVSSIMSGFLYCIGPVTSGLVSVYGCRKVSILGSMLTTAGMAASAVFSPVLYALYLTVGVVVGSGMGLTYIPSANILLVWFEKRLALATGMSSCGSGVGIAVFALLYDRLIAAFGWRGALLMIAGLMSTTVTFSALFRVPHDASDNEADKGFKDAMKEMMNFQILKTWLFFHFLLTDVLVTMVAFVPLIWMAERVAMFTKGRNKDAAYVTAFFGLTNGVSRVVFGFVADWESIDRLALFNHTVVATGVAIGFSIFATTFWTYFLFVAVFGILQGSYNCLYSVILVDLFGSERLANVMGITLFFDGIASMVGPPLISLTVGDVDKSYDLGLFLSALITFVAGLMQYFLPYIKQRVDR